MRAPVGKGGSPSAKMATAIDASFGSLDDFKAKFEAAGAPGARFGSGWVWLVVTKDGELAITSTPRTTRSGCGGHPRYPYPRLRRLGTRILSEVPVPSARLHQGLVGRCELESSERLVQGCARGQGPSGRWLISGSRVRWCAESAREREVTVQSKVWCEV